MPKPAQVLLVTPPLIADNATVVYPSLPYLAASLEQAGISVSYLNLNLAFQVAEKRACLSACRKLRPTQLAAAYGQHSNFLGWAELFCKMVGELGSRIDVTRDGSAVVDSRFSVDDFFQHVWRAYSAGLMPRLGIDTNERSFGPLTASPRYDQFVRDELKDGDKLDGISTVAITAPMVDNIGYAIRLREIIKEIRPDIQVVAGGTAFSALPSWTLDLLRQQCRFDAVVEGPGEDVIIDIAHRRTSGTGSLGAISRQAYAESRKAVKGPTLSSLAPVKFPAPEFRDPTSVEVALVQSRGCYWGECVYCSYPELYGSNRYQERDVDVLADEIKRHADLGFRKFRLVNDTLRQGYAASLASALVRRGIDIAWRSFMRAEPFSESTLEEIARSGGNSFIIGLETVSDRLLKFVKKGVKKESAEILFRRLAKVGVRVEVNIIPDLPTSTVDEALESLHFLEEHIRVIYRLNVSTLVVPIRSPMARAPHLYGLKLLDVQPDYLDQTGLLYFSRVSGATDDELEPVIRQYKDLAREINKSNIPFSADAAAVPSKYVFRHCREVDAAEAGVEHHDSPRSIEFGYDIRTGSYHFEGQ